MQELLVITIVCAAVAYIARCAWSAFRGKTACGGGCGSCGGKGDGKSLLSIQPLAEPPLRGGSTTRE